MAEWRSRGYVPDSDDEDESQNSPQPVFSNGQTLFTRGDDIDDTVCCGLNDEDLGFQHSTGGSRQDDEQSRSGNAKSKSIDYTLSGFSSHHGHCGVPIESVSDRGDQNGDPPLPEYGDIDELQEDHYQGSLTSPSNEENPRGDCNLAGPISATRPPALARLFSLSPLSSPSSNPPESPNGPSSSADQIQSSPSMQRTRGGSPTRASSSQLIEFPHVNRTAEPTRTARNLRQRNPIQLHPYAIESEKYRQILKDRGVKPLRIAQMEAEAGSARRVESQNVEYQGHESQDTDTNNYTVDFASSSPLGDQDDTLSLAPDIPDDMPALGDDELPDISTVFSKPLQTYVENGNKRRKVVSASFRMPSAMSREVNKASLEDMASSIHNSDNVVDGSLPSPPRSGTQTSVETPRVIVPTFQPRSTSNQTLPTPVTSSEPRKPQVLDISEDELSDDDSRDQAELEVSRDESDSDEESYMKIAPNHLERVQRKIRGVLPASWLKIDLKAQNKGTDNARRAPRSPSPQRIGTHRGIARPVIARESGSPDRKHSNIDVFSISDSGRSLSDRKELRRKSPTRQRIDLSDNDNDDFWEGRVGEAAEDDRIDAMLPSKTRVRRFSRRNKKRQTKLDIVRPNSSMIDSHRDNSRIDRRDRSYPANQVNKERRKSSKLRPPNLSILDASSLNRSLGRSTPPFLKVATRTVRLRKDRGRHSPSRKYVRLATRKDDEDANGTLQDWREGTIMPTGVKGSSPGPARKPLHPRSANDATSPYGTDILGSKSRSMGTLQSKQASHQQASFRSRKLQPSLDHLVVIHPKQNGEPTEVERPSVITEQIKKPRKLVSTLRENQYLRPAMLEHSRTGTDELQANYVFRQDLSRINRINGESRLENVLRLFEKDTRILPSPLPQRNDIQNESSRSQQSKHITRKPTMRRRKRQPQRLDVSASSFRRADTPITMDESPDIVTFDETNSSHGEVVTGLGPFGTWYSDTFGITPLPTCTCFPANTFFGSGAFMSSQKLDGSSGLDSSRGYAVLSIYGKPYRWGPWNDSVSSELGEEMACVLQSEQPKSVESQNQSQARKWPNDYGVHALTAIVAYFSDHLSFLDPIDRLSCLQRCKQFITNFALKLEEMHSNRIAISSYAQRNTCLETVLQLGTIGLAFTDQARQISRHDLVPVQLHDEIQVLMRRIAQMTVSLATTEGIEDFETCILRCKYPDNDRYTIQREQISIQAFVVAHQVLTRDNDCLGEFWQTVQISTPPRASGGTFDMHLAEISWRKLFTLLPFLKFGSDGLLATGRRFSKPSDNWPLIKRLVSPVLEVSLANPKGQSPSFNAYCRALFCRCLHLINSWGWRHCESAIGMLFDFFARNQLAHLRNEESHGSPLFLEHLSKNPSLVSEPHDRCFHVLLKIIGSGIRHMKHFYPEKKIRDLTWRLMPNHGRFHPKEEAVRQADLDALRNHHDLLCTLYWASPPDCRPRLSLVRNLVQLENSHREACHINIRAWFHLVKFQLSTDESITYLEAFMAWHDDLLTQILRQHSLARTEAEDQVRSIQHTESLLVSHDLLESTIAKNQRQIEAILSDALVSLKLAINVAKDGQTASSLMSTTLSGVFALFDAGKPQVTKTVTQALDVVSAFARKCEEPFQPRLRDNNDDSQDYGDWPTFDDEDEGLAVARKRTNDLALQNFQEPLRHLLSNAFGSDVFPVDDLLVKIIDVWVAVAQVLVSGGGRSWNDYLDRFGNDSWNSLRDTEQTRKYTPLYLATLIEKVPDLCSEHATFFLTSWINSLVERESFLKYQHRLTEALLNANSIHPILRNLPFCMNASTSRSTVSAAEFAERRISLISSVLSNMRVSLENAVFDASVNPPQLRQEYKDLLKNLMGTMKRNYQELGGGSNMKGAYVKFVHTVVELLQQYISTICPIDRFFTDNGAFPLPATDPTYVVGQLKHYALRLQESRTPKQLAVFLQSVSERAAADGQQLYLVSQLHLAISRVFENSAPEKPTLRFFLVQALIPAYIEMACDQSISCCGWILALPYLQALQMDFNDLLLDQDGTSAKSVEAVASVITAFVGSLRKSFSALLRSTSYLEEPGILKLISACYMTMMVLLPTLDYLIRLSRNVQRAVNNLSFLKDFALHVTARLHEHDEPPPIEDEHTEEPAYADTRRFATQELKDTLTKNWSYVRNEQQYYFSRGASRREVVVDIGLWEQEKANLLKVFAEFFKTVRVMPALCDEDDEIMAIRGKPMLGSDDLIF